MKKFLLFLGFVVLSYGLLGCKTPEQLEAEATHIRFESNGGSEVADMRFLSSETRALPTPTKEGHTFLGWYANEDLSGVAHTTVETIEDDIMLYAKWQINQGTIQFNTMGGSDIDPVVAEYGTALDPPNDPIKEGYIFIGWYTDDSFTDVYTFTTMPDDTVTIYALWEGREYTIDFEAYGGASVSDIVARYEDDITAPTEPTKEGYDFGGWYVDPTFTSQFTFSTMPLNGITLHAKWNPALVDVTIYRYTEDLDQTGYTLAQTDTIEAYTESIYTLTSDSLLGFTPDMDHELNILNGTVLPDGSLELRLYYTRNTITIIFESNADFSVASLSGLFESPIVKPEDPDRSGYVFIDWVTDDTLMTPYTFTTFPGEDITLYAVWEGTPSTLSFITYGGTTLADYTANNGEVLILPLPEKTGYDFVGWYLSDSFVTMFNEPTMPVGGGTLHAKWTPKIYTLSFDAQGGAAVDSLGYHYGQAIDTLTESTLENYAFAGWFFDETCLEPFNLELMPDYDITLYAKWIDNTNPYSVYTQTLQTEGSAVRIQGTIYAVYTATYQGFMIFDHTGHVFIDYAHTNLGVGDMVDIIGVLEFDDNIPVIRGVSSLTVMSSDNPTKSPHTIDIVTIDTLGQTKTHIHNVYQSQGFIYKDDARYFLVDLESMTHIPLYYKSYLSDNITLLDGMTLDSVTLTYALVYKNNQYQASLISVEANPMTDAGIVALLKTLADEALTQTRFIAGDYFSIPSADELGLATISYIVTGDHASYYDTVNQVFLETDIERDLSFEITIALNDSTETLTFTHDITLTPVTLSTIFELLHGETGSYYRIQGIVVSKTEMGMTIIKDATGVVFADFIPGVQIGDEVILTVRREVFGNTILLTSDNGGITINDILSHENELNLTPEYLDTNTILTLDLLDKSLYGKYVEVRGFIVDDFGAFSHGQYLTTDQYTILIEPSGHEGFEKLFDYHYIEVIMRGYLYTDEDNNIIIIYEGIRQDIRIPEYTDAERVDVIEHMLYYMYSGKTYDANTYFDMIPHHQIIGGTITWSMNAQTDAVYDQDNKHFLPVTEDTPLTFTITITEGSVSKTLTFNATLKAVEITPVHTLHQLDHYGNYYVRGTIVYWHPDFAYLMDDAGDLILLDIELKNTRKGDYLILYGQWQIRNNGAVYLSKVYYQDTIIKELSRENTVTYTYTPETVVDIVSQDPYSPLSFNRFIEITGYLTTHQYETMRLDTPDGTIYINSPDTYTFRQLEQYANKNVVLRGYLHIYNPSKDAWEIMYIGLPGDITSIDYTDQETFNLMKQYLLDYYHMTIEGGQYFDFGQIYDLFDKGTITLLPTGTNASLVDTSSGYISEVTSITPVDVEVTLSVGDITETFVITITITPEAVTIINTIDDLINAPNDTVVIRAQVVSITRLKNNSFMFLLEDETGIIFLPVTYQAYYTYKDYNGYIGETLEITGKATADKGRFIIQPQTWKVHSRSGSINKTFIETPLNTVNEMSLYDPSIYGSPVSVTGTIISETIDNVTHYYISNGFDRVRISTFELWNTDIRYHEGYMVTLDGFVFGSNDLFNDRAITLMYYPYNFDSEKPLKLTGYTDEAMVSMALDDIIARYNAYNPLYYPNDYIAKHDITATIKNNYPSMTVTYTLLENAIYLEDNVYYWLAQQAPTDLDVTVEITVTYGDIVQTETIIFSLNGFAIKSISEVFLDVPGTFEIALDGQLILSGHGFYYFLIENQVYYLESHTYTWADSGEHVIIVAKKNIIDGIANYTYDITVITTDYGTLSLTPTPTTIEELYTNDYTQNPLQFDYLRVSGTLGYDAYLEMFTLEANGRIIYIRTNIDGYEGKSIYFNYLGEHVEVNILLPMKTVRDTYILVDSIGGSSNITMPELSETDALARTADRLSDYQTISVYAGDTLENLPWHYYLYDTNITYELVDPLDAQYVDLSNKLTYTVDVPTDVLINATITYYGGTLTETVQITLTILPRNTTTINDILWGDIGTTYQIQGIIVAASGLDDYPAWMIIEDATGTIYVDLSTAHYSLFGYDTMSFNVGDEILLIADLDSFDYHGVVPELYSVRVIHILSSNNTITKTPTVMTFEDILALDYLHPESFFTYVEITATLNSNGSYYYPEYHLSDDTYYSDYMNMYYPLYIRGQDATTFNDTMQNMVGQTVTMRGYLLGFDYLWTDFDWHIAYDSHDVIVPTS